MAGCHQGSALPPLQRRLPRRCQAAARAVPAEAAPAAAAASHFAQLAKLLGRTGTVPPWRHRGRRRGGAFSAQQGASEEQERNRCCCTSRVSGDEQLRRGLELGGPKGRHCHASLAGAGDP